MGVVDADEERTAGTEGTQQVEQGRGREAGPQDVGGRGGQWGWGRAEQLVQSAVGQELFRGSGCGVQDRSVAVTVHGVAQEGAAAEAGGRGEHERTAATGSQAGRQGVQEGQFSASAVQPEGTVHGRRWGHGRYVTSA